MVQHLMFTISLHRDTLNNSWLNKKDENLIGLHLLSLSYVICSLISTICYRFVTAKQINTSKNLENKGGA